MKRLQTNYHFQYVKLCHPFLENVRRVIGAKQTNVYLSFIRVTCSSNILFVPITIGLFAIIVTFGYK